MEELYRYISFESFVGMVQKQALTFVSPELWDDSKELEPFFEFTNLKIKPYDQIVGNLIYLKTFCQSWTSLSESDAMWRIYAYNNFSVRIRIKIENVELLKKVKIAPVHYTDDFSFSDDVLELFAIKRIAFKHEREIRLVNIDVFELTELNDKIKEYMAIEKPELTKSLVKDLYADMSHDEKIEEFKKELNYGEYRKFTNDVSFAHIPNFIEGVMVNPFAPDWFVEVVEEYCKRNNIHFDGKSKLYYNE